MATVELFEKSTDRCGKVGYFCFEICLSLYSCSRITRLSLIHTVPSLEISYSCPSCQCGCGVLTFNCSLGT